MAGRPKKDIRVRVKENYPQFFEEVKGLSPADLNSRLAQLSKGREEILDAKEADEDLDQARDNLNAIQGHYKDALKRVQLQSSFIIALLKDKGAA